MCQRKNGTSARQAVLSLEGYKVFCIENFSLYAINHHPPQSLSLNPKALNLLALGIASATTFAPPVSAVQLQQDFAGVYAPANWTFTSDPALGDGSVDTSGAPASITITGSDNGGSLPFSNVNTDYTIAVGLAGPASFDWSYSSSDCCNFDGFGYLLNGNFTQLAQNSSQGSGFTQFNVLAGDTFGFRVFALDNAGSPGVATISNFSAPVPGPLPLLGVGAAFGYSRRLRRRINLSTGPVSSASGSSDQL